MNEPTSDSRLVGGWLYLGFHLNELLGLWRILFVISVSTLLLIMGNNCSDFRSCRAFVDAIQWNRFV